MVHTFANESYAAERYLLGEMTPEERDDFEDHFFTCRQCAEVVQLCSVFVENAKTVFREDPVAAAPLKERFEFSWDWLRALHLSVAIPSFAALALAGVCVYQALVLMPALKAPQSMGSPLILDGMTRATLPAKESDKPLHFQMLLPHTPDGDRVMVEIDDPNAVSVRSGFVDAPDVKEPLDVFFPGKLEPGRYVLIARSAKGFNAGQELARNAFEIVEPVIPIDLLPSKPDEKKGSSDPK